LVELFSKSSQVEGGALVARRSERNSPAFKRLRAWVLVREAPIQNSIREADTLFHIFHA